MGVRQELVDALAEPLDVAGRHEHESVAGGGDLLGPGLAAASDRGQATGHRLDVGHPERLLSRGHHEQRASPRLLERLCGRQLPEGAQDIGVALACNQVRDRHEGWGGRASHPSLHSLASRRMRGGGEIGAEVHHARLAGAVGARQLGDSPAVGEHQAGGAQSACHCREARGGAGRRSGGRVEHVAAVHGDDQRHVQACTAHGVSGRHGVVGMNQVESKRAT